ncbi:S-adenosyl-L-methionine-dependent methyltransferase [Lasiosphaeria ovina]|uniref:S-adenosyl-L-methionine-dependent methyltransferase n=1 Tax=Lasiosphaeria ovina TaxID=92902 RepID=A0AAE0NB81_9PEZI|nr:S-adenosyl-L-methionine-dependent methyltransferase [Lasiosphaeria ovina]
MATATMTVNRPLVNTFAPGAVASSYEEELGAMVAISKMVVDLAPPITSASVIHDNACGPGVVTAAILAKFHAENPGNTTPPPRIIATDIAPNMVELAARKGPSVEAHVMDSRRLTNIPDNSLTHSFTDFLFVRGWGEADMVAFASEIRRTLRPGATAVNAAWKYHEWHTVLRDALERTLPGAEGAAEVDERMPRQPWSKESVLAVFAKAGFHPDRTTLHTVQHTPREPIEWDSKLWRQFLAAANEKVTRGMDDPTKDRYYANLAARTDEDKANPKEYRWEAWVLTAVK